jgi:hypothetical protein
LLQIDERIGGAIHNGEGGPGDGIEQGLVWGITLITFG